MALDILTAFVLLFRIVLPEEKRGEGKQELNSSYLKMLLFYEESM